MTECWVRANRRPLLAAMVLPALAAAGGLCAVVWAPGVVWKSAGGAVAVLGLAAVAGLAVFMRQPRLGFDGRSLLVNLRLGRPIHVPVDVVEVFFLGQGASMTSPAAARIDADDQPQTATIVVRLAERAESWHRRQVEQRLGHWCDGYIIVRGTHCEPVTGELVSGLNERLRTAHRQLRAAKESDRQKESS